MLSQNEILRIYGTDYKNMTARLLEEADLAGLIDRKMPGRCDVRIGIKPNLVSPTPAMYGATTHPELVAGIIEYLQSNGFRKITICEGSWVGDKTADAFLYCGYQDLAEQYGVRLFDTQKDTAADADAAGMALRICRCVADIDFLINVPVLKGHCQTKVTCALKNMKGLIPNTEKRRFHSLGLHKPIAHLNTAIRQDFIVTDHICGDPDFEDGGNPLIRNCVMAGLDPVLMDTLACRILNYEPEDVPYITLAQKLGVGSTDLAHARLRTIGKKAEIEGSSKSSAQLSHKLLQLNYAIEEIESCSACYSALIGALDRLQKDGLLEKLTEEEKIRFCIGQGYRGCSAPDTGSVKTHENTVSNADQVLIGIGNCTGNFETHIPGCPPTEDTIYEYLTAYLQTY